MHCSGHLVPPLQVYDSLRNRLLCLVATRFSNWQHSEQNVRLGFERSQVAHSAPNAASSKSVLQQDTTVYFATNRTLVKAGRGGQNNAFEIDMFTADSEILVERMR